MTDKDVKTLALIKKYANIVPKAISAKNVKLITLSIYLPDKDQKPVQSIYSIIEDKHRQLWVGAMGAGLYRINLDTKEIYRCPSTANGFAYRPLSNILHNS